MTPHANTTKGREPMTPQAQTQTDTRTFFEVNTKTNNHHNKQQ